MVCARCNKTGIGKSTTSLPERHAIHITIIFTMNFFGPVVPVSRPFDEARKVVQDKLVRKGMLVKMRSQGVLRFKWARIRGDTLHLRGVVNNCIDLSDVREYKRTGTCVELAGVVINFRTITLAMAMVLTIQDFSERYEHFT